MCDEWKKYIDDPRTICKYGSKCYQKNAQHHTTYKHPPPRNSKTSREKRTQRRFSPYSRDTKQNNSDNKDEEQESSKEAEEPTVNTNNKMKVANEENESTQQNKVDSSANEPTMSNSHVQKAEPCWGILQDNLATYDPDSSHNLIKELFLVEMPLDFFKLYDFLNIDNSFEKTLSTVNLEAVGPYDLILGKLPILDDKELYLTHWRFFYDPPEFQTVFKKKGKSEYHIGYFRDDPNEQPVFLAHNDSSRDCHITPMSSNIAGALYMYLQDEKKTSPFIAMMCQKLMDKIKQYAAENNFSLEEYNIKKRLSHVVTKSFHGAGIVVPYNKKTQLGYRHLVETDANIKKLFAKFQAATSESEKDNVLSEIQPIITYASIAVDECDFGTGVEVGIDLFCSGIKELEPAALSSLTAAYSLLNREAFSKIIQAHLKLRRRGPYMSILSLPKQSKDVE